jgi:hypothetical protein
MKKVIASAFVSLMLVSTAVFAVPTVQQIESAMSQGNWQQTDAGLSEVLKAHPNNAHAHYLYSQVLDREGRYGDALAQVQQAKTLDPQIRFTDPTRFAQVEARIRHDAERTANTSGNGGGTGIGTLTNRTTNPFGQQNAPAVQQAPERHGPGIGMWVGILILVGVIALVLRWTLRRARTQDDTRADDDRRVQLKRATELLNSVRSLKLDVKLSTVQGHEALEKEVEATEDQLRGLVETLSNSKNPVPPYQLDELEQRIGSMRARADGRPDPYAASASAPAAQQSPYAQEAERFGNPPQAPYPQQGPYQQQPPVVVQQGGGGFGGGMGGLLTGVLLGEALNSGRERVVERDVVVDDEARRRGNDGGNGGGLDFGQGSNDWNDNGGGVDLGSSDDSGSWNDNT